MKVEKPYFMSNNNWYYYDVKTFKYKLTDKGVSKAINSYNDYYDEELEMNDVGAK